jgi:DNA-binding transcriptional LysR family regulator
MTAAAMDTLRGLYVFARVAEQQSFSRAAASLGMTKSAVSKHVAQLEAQLGVQLLIRTTRKLALTDAGERVYDSSARMAQEAEAAHEAAQSEGGALTGTLRVTAPYALGRTYLMPVVTEFLALHRDLSIDVVLDDAFVDLIGERIDIALRVGRSRDQSLISRRVARVEFFLVAAPSYLERHGKPRAPEDLAAHEWVVHSPSRPMRVVLRRSRQAVTLDTGGRLASNDGPANLAAVREGHGIVGVPDFEVADDLRDGTLVRILPRWKIDETALHLVFPPRRHVLGRVRAFADLLAARFSDPPWRARRADERSR